MLKVTLNVLTFKYSKNLLSTYSYQVLVSTDFSSSGCLHHGGNMSAWKGIASVLVIGRGQADMTTYSSDLCISGIQNPCTWLPGRV